ncbi:MAG: hypothetical protein K8J31_24360 [Anaerolineae bacterium]|nr:hypothetical protein [Anaerolineae bacterium]
MSDIFKTAWSRLLVITAVIGDVQGRFIAVLFYYTVLVPFGIGTRLSGDPLHMKVTQGQSQWLDRPPTGSALDDARKQG